MIRRPPDAPDATGQLETNVTVRARFMRNVRVLVDCIRLRILKQPKNPQELATIIGWSIEQLKAYLDLMPEHERGVSFRQIFSEELDDNPMFGLIAHEQRLMAPRNFDFEVHDLFSLIYGFSLDPDSRQSMHVQSIWLSFISEIAGSTRAQLPDILERMRLAITAIPSQF